MKPLHLPGFRQTSQVALDEGSRRSAARVPGARDGEADADEVSRMEFGDFA